MNFSNFENAINKETIPSKEKEEDVLDNTEILKDNGNNNTLIELEQKMQEEKLICDKLNKEVETLEEINSSLGLDTEADTSVLSELEIAKLDYENTKAEIKKNKIANFLEITQDKFKNNFNTKQLKKISLAALTAMSINTANAENNTSTSEFDAVIEITKDVDDKKKIDNNETEGLVEALTNPDYIDTTHRLVEPNIVLDQIKSLLAETKAMFKEFNYKLAEYDIAKKKYKEGNITVEEYRTAYDNAEKEIKSFSLESQPLYDELYILTDARKKWQTEHNGATKIAIDIEKVPHIVDKLNLPKKIDINQDIVDELESPLKDNELDKPDVLIKSDTLNSKEELNLIEDNFKIKETEYKPETELSYAEIGTAKQVINNMISEMSLKDNDDALTNLYMDAGIEILKKKLIGKKILSKKISIEDENELIKSKIQPKIEKMANKSFAGYNINRISDLIDSPNFKTELANQILSTLIAEKRINIDFKGGSISVNKDGNINISFEKEW